MAGRSYSGWCSIRHRGFSEAFSSIAFVEELLDDARVDYRSTGGDRPDGVAQLAAIPQVILEEVCPSVRAGFEERQRIRRLGVVAEHDDADVRMRGPQLFGDADPLVGLA